MIKNILSHFRYWPHARKRYGQMGAISIVGTPTTVQRGIELAETGIVCRRFQVRYFPEVNDKLEGITGEATLRGISSLFSRDISAEGEVSGATGIMAFALAATCAFANDVAVFGTGVGRILLDEATETQERGGWRSVAVRCSSNPLLV